MKRTRDPLTRWVPWSIVACFAFVTAVNGALAYFALSSETGLVARHPFELGNGYNRILDAGAAQDALGWKGTAQFAPERGRAGRIVVALSDAGGAPLAGLAVTVAVVRPVEPLPEQHLTLTAANGRYEAPVTLTRPGQWELRVTASRGGDVYQFAERIVAP